MSPRYHLLPPTKRAVGVALVSLLAALLGFLSPSEQDLRPPPTHPRLFPAQLLDRSPLDDRIFGGSEYSFGRWRTPVTNTTFHPDASSWKAETFQVKRWHYASVNTRDYFVGMAVVGLGYANDAFLYVVDKTASGEAKFEYSGK